MIRILWIAVRAVTCFPFWATGWLLGVAYSAVAVPAVCGFQSAAERYWSK